LLVEGAEKASSRLGGELVVAETDTNLPTSELEAVHLSESLFGVGGVNEPVSVS
jgi:hypothetical protein